MIRIATVVAGALSTLAVLAPMAHAVTPGPAGRIAFVADATAGVDIFAANPDGTGTRRLTTTSAREEGPTWSPDGTKIAYARDGAVWLMNADGSGQVRLASGAPGSWSPDGQRIAISYYDGARASLATIAVDGSDLEPVTSGPAGSSDSSPSWSPDGARLLFSHQVGFGSEQLWIVDIDGTDAHALATDASTNVYAGDWSPDGTKIVYTVGQGASGRVYVANADGSARSSVTSGQRPSWSPDGSQIVVQSSQQMSRPGQLFPKITIAPSSGGPSTWINVGGYTPAWGTAPLVTGYGEGTAVIRPQCADGIDDDGDGRADYPEDPGCDSVNDDSELKPACSNRKDDDGDGRIDYPDDPGCSSSADTRENERFGTVGCYAAGTIVAGSRSSVVGGPLGPCTTASSELGLPAIGPLTVTGIGGQTTMSPTQPQFTFPATTDHATANIAVGRVALQVAGLSLVISNVTASAEYNCSAGVSLPSDPESNAVYKRSSGVGTIKLGLLQLAGTSKPQTIGVPGGALRLNTDYTYPESRGDYSGFSGLTVRRAVWLDLPGDLADVVVGEAAVAGNRFSFCSQP